MIQNSLKYKLIGLTCVLLLIALSSCYAPLDSVRGKQSFKDSTLVVFERDIHGDPIAVKEYNYISKRKTKIKEERFLPFPVMPDATDSTGPDTIVGTEIFDKEFKIDNNIFTRRRKLKSYYGGSGILAEKTKQRSQIKDGCEIVISKRTKMYNEFGEVVMKERFNGLWWRQVRLIYDPSGKKLQSRKVRFMFKPKFRNYP